MQPLEPGRVPSDKQVFLITLAIHVVGFVIILMIHTADSSKRPFQTEEYAGLRGDSHNLHEWETKLEEYIGLVEDFFLLP